MRARAPHTPKQVPSSQHSTAPSWAETTGHRADKQQPRTATWFFLSVQEKLQSHQVPWQLPSKCNNKLPTNSLFRVTTAHYEVLQVSFCFFGMYYIWSLLIWNAGHIFLRENLCLYWEGRGWESMTRTSTFIYGIFYSFVSCCIHIKKHSMCFITYLRTFPNKPCEEDSIF